MTNNNSERGLFLPLTWGDGERQGVYLPAEVVPVLSEVIETKAGKKLVLVEAISQYRMRYVVECDDVTHAEDEVCMERAQEFSQYHLGEVITSSREITGAEYLELFDRDNDYLQNWTEDKKYGFIHRIDYES